MKLDVIGFGALNLDKLYRVDRIIEEGESFILSSKESPGGSAANTIVGLARLGLRVGYVGKLSLDREGRILLEDLKREKVNRDGVIISKSRSTGVVMGFVDKGGRRALYVDPGVNDTLEFKEIDLSYVRSANFLHLTSFVGKKPFEAQQRIVREISSIEISFDPGEIYTCKGLAMLQPLIKRSSVLFLNESELRMLTRRGCKLGSKALIKRGARVIAVKLGEKGCWVTDGKEGYLVEAFKAKVLDTTGAGDAFNAGFLWGLIKGKDLYECGRLGNWVASRCIAKIGARAGLPWLENLRNRFC